MPTKLTSKIIESLEPNSGICWDATVPGLGVRSGRNRKTFFYSGRVRGKRSKLKIKIGVYAEPHPEGHVWTLKRARIEAGTIKGMLANGINPNAKADATELSGPTLREGLELHLDSMQRKKRARRSIETMRGDVEKHFRDWLDRPLAELTAIELGAIHDRVVATTKPRAGSVNPPGHALAKRLVINIGSIWKSLNRKHAGALGGWNPAEGVQTHSLAPREARLGAKAESDMSWPLWYERVLGLSGCRRDIQLLALFSGIRAEGLRNLRWEDIDEAAGCFSVRVVKGDRPYSVPLCKTIRDIFASRRKENPALALFDGYTGDEGWVFPTRTRSKPFAVVPLAEPKEWRIINDERVQWLPGLHPLRRTYASVAAEAGVDEFTIKILMNHQIAGVTGKHYTQLENLERFAKAQATIETALWTRLTHKKKSQKLKAM